MNVHIGPYYMLITFLDILTQFLNGDHFGTFLSFAILPMQTVIETSYMIWIFTYPMI